MIIKLKNADFSSNNINSLLNSYLVTLTNNRYVNNDSYTSSVDKSASSYTATFSVKSNCELYGVTVTGGTGSVTPTMSSSNPASAGTVVTVSVTGITGNINISFSGASLGGDDPVIPDEPVIPDVPDEPETPTGSELEEIQTTTGYYINSSNLTNTTNEAFNIGKYDVSTASRIKATCRQGTVSAAVFTNAQGVRTLAGTGNTDSGVNFIEEFDVPYDAVYFELTYATKYEHSVIKLAEREVIDVDSYTIIESESTTEGYYIDKDMNNAENYAFVIGKYNVSNYSKVYVEARIGSVAYLAWTDASGKRTQAGVGNSGTGLNYKQILTVPESAVYLEFGYSTSQPCVVKGGE